MSAESEARLLTAVESIARSLATIAAVATAADPQDAEESPVERENPLRTMDG